MDADEVAYHLRELEADGAPCSVIGAETIRALLADLKQVAPVVTAAKVIETPSEHDDHRGLCSLYLYDPEDPQWVCTCGLDSLRDAVNVVPPELLERLSAMEEA